MKKLTSNQISFLTTVSALFLQMNINKSKMFFVLFFAGLNGVEMSF